MGLSRRQLWVSLKLLEEPSHTGLHEITESIYRAENEEAWRQSGEESPHGAAWHTSFHASSFPGDAPKACGRAALYGLMRAPKAKPAEPWLVAVGEAGKDIEMRLVMRWFLSGRLLSASPTDEYQTNFEKRELWLTCSCDAVLDLRPEWPHAHPVDVKSKDHQFIDDLRSGKRKADPAHVRQLMLQVYFCREAHEEMGWDELGLEPAVGGSLYYVSRQRPRHAHEVYIEFDENVIEAGFGQLKEWKEDFIAGVLPERPKGWRWTEDPCRWCNHKETCKSDIALEVTRLVNSTGVDRAAEIDPNYDYDKVRAAVLGRWNGGGL